MDDKRALKEAFDFFGLLSSTYIETLDMVARKPFAEAVNRNMQVIVSATQQPPAEKGKEKK